MGPETELRKPIAALCRQFDEPEEALEELLAASDQGFQQLCHATVERMGLDVQEVGPIHEGCAIVGRAADDPSDRLPADR